MSEIFKCEMKVKACCDYYDLEKFILSVYGVRYEIMPSEEVGSSQYDAKYSVTAEKGEMSEYRKKDFEKWKETGKGSFVLDSILMDLCNRNLMIPGEYLIDVSW